MAGQTESHINWEPYLADINSYYVADNHTARETIAHLRQRFGLCVTEKQFKTKFPGQKNIRSDEWQAIVPTLKKRAHEGKESDLYLNGKLVNAKKVKREVARRHMAVPPAEAPMFENVIGQSIQDRIYISTPGFRPSQPDGQFLAATVSRDPASLQVEGHVTATESYRFGPAPNTFQALDGSALGEAILPSPPEWAASNSNADAAIPPSDNGFGAVTDLEISDARMWNDIFPQFSSVFGFPSMIEGSRSATPPAIATSSSERHHRLRLLANLPCYELASRLSLIPNPNPIPSVFLTPPSPRLSALSTPRLAPDSDPTPLGSKHGLESVTRLLLSFNTFDVIFPESFPGIVRNGIQSLLDPRQQDLVHELLMIALYLHSNNMLHSWQASGLALLIADKYAKPFLELIPTNLPTIQDFGSTILISAARAHRMDFCRQLFDAGVRLESIPPSFMEIKDTKILKLMLSKVNQSVLRGQSGGVLLRAVASTKSVEIAQMLIKAGAEVNITLSEKLPSTPLWEAVNHRNLEMVQCLVTGGADVNELSWHKPESCLALAVIWSHSQIAEYLVKQGARTNVCLNETPLLTYVRHRPAIRDAICGSASQPIFDRLVDAANISQDNLAAFVHSKAEQVSQHDLEDALLSAVKVGETKAIVNLLEFAVDPNCPLLGTTLSTKPLFIAIHRKDTSQESHHHLDLLLHAGANVNVEQLLEEISEDLSEVTLGKLLKAGLDLHRVGPEGLIQALVWGCEEQVFHLLSAGTPIDTYGTTHTVMQAVSVLGGLRLFHHLIRMGGDINKPAYAAGGCTSLQGAAYSRISPLQKVQCLLDLGAEVNSPRAISAGMTALEATVRPNNLLLNKFFLEGGKDSYDNDEALVAERRILFQILLDRGAKVCRPDRSPSPLLHDIIERKDCKLLRLALEAGADPECTWATVSSSKSLRTPLQLAAETGQLAAVESLLERGANPNAPASGKYGRTALQAAVSLPCPNMGIVNLLLSKEVSVNEPPALIGGVTALQGAAIQGNINIALLLLEKGADVNALPALRDGCTAIEGAAKNGRLDMVQLLLNAGAKGDVIGADGLSDAMELAETNRHFVVAKLLTDHGRAKSERVGTGEVM